MGQKHYISIKKAAALTGYSAREMNELCEAIADTDVIKKKNGKRFVQISWLRDNYPVPVSACELAESSVPSLLTPPSDTLVALLQTQIVEKDKQLAIKDAQITQLIERTREQNNIIYSLQHHKQVSEVNTQVPLSKPNLRNQSTGDYRIFGAVMLLVGVVLVIFYSVLIS